MQALKSKSIEELRKNLDALEKRKETYNDIEETIHEIKASLYNKIMKKLLEEENMIKNTQLYNSYVKEKYAIDMKGMEFLISEELNILENDEPYHEIASYQTKCGHAVIFEPEF